MDKRKRLTSVVRTARRAFFAFAEDLAAVHAQ